MNVKSRDCWFKGGEQLRKYPPIYVALILTSGYFPGSFPPPIFHHLFLLPRRGGACLLAYLAPAHCKVSDDQATFEGPPELSSALARTLLLVQVMNVV